MTKEHFLQDIQKTYSDGFELLKRKNADYASTNDPYQNFRFAEIVGVPIERAILVRMSDKLARISNILTKPAEVKDETIEDTLLDLINYTAILKVYICAGNVTRK